MIYTDSRYATGTVIKAQDARNETYRLGVYRNFPNAKFSFYYYTWVVGDRIDIVSNHLLGSPTFWWKIMDANPELIDPFSIPVGTTIRIPSV
jgi:hypothetical protein